MGTRGHVDGNGADTQESRDALRRDFPHVGLLHDPWTGRWKAVWGVDGYADAATPEELRQRLLRETPGRT